MRMPLRLALLLPFSLSLALTWSCRGEAPAPKLRVPLLVVGIDGGEQRVLDRLWRQGRLPNLKAIAERGTSGTLRTAYNSSPVIWTTIATGVRPEVHGITDFVVATPQGDVPISSSVRKVPALWNMLSRVGKKVAVLGWWGSWPAEEINGVVVSDRTLLGLAEDVSPPELAPRFAELVKRADADPGRFDRADGAQRRDLAMARMAEELMDEEYDLILLYFRTPDIESHRYWASFEPESFPEMDRAELARHADRIPRVYEAVDEAVGRILAASPGEPNVVVLSDHGFHATRGGEEIQIEFDMDAVLERLGYLVRKGAAVDFTRTRAYTYATPPHRRAKLIRLAPQGGETREELLEKLQRDLAVSRFAGGAPVFWLREPRPKEIEQGADLVAVVSLEGATPTFTVQSNGEGLSMGIHRISGTHTTTTHGIFLAAGPDIAPGADLNGIHVHDIAPTLLYGLGIPVAQDFVGKPWQPLFTEEFRRRMPLRTLRTWGVRTGAGAARPSEADEKLLEELRALGYLR